MALQPIQTAIVAGITPSFNAVAASDTVQIPDDRCYLHVKNGSGAGITVTLVTPGTVGGGLAIADNPQTVAAGAERIFPLPPGLYVDPATSLVTVTYSATTTVTAAVVRI